MASRDDDHDEALLSSQGAGYQVRYRGRPLYGGNEPVSGAERRAAALSPESRTLYLLPSPLLGYGLNTLIAALPEDSHVLAIEVDASLAALSRQQLPESITASQALTLLFAPTDEETQSAVRKIGLKRFRRVRLVTLNGGYSLHADAYRAILAYLQEEIQRQWQNTLTEVHLGRRWTRNLLRNLALLPESADLPALRSDRPIVVAAAGPSLEESLPLLRRIRREVTLLAVDTAAAPLVAAGIPPDMVLSLDGQWANLQDFVPPLPAETALLTELSTHPTVARNAAGGRWFFSTAFAPLRLLERLTARGLRPFALPPRGSVGITAVEVALSLTPAPVFVAGLDLAFDSLRTHARGSTVPRWHHRQSRRLDPLPAWRLAHRHGLLRRPDKNGRATVTSAVLLSYARQLQEIVPARAGDRVGGGRVYDIGPGGLDLGLPRLREEELPPILSQSPGRAETGPESTASWSARDIDLFLEAELALLQDSEEETARRLSGEARLGDPEFRELIEQVDYVWLHFPDPASLEGHFLARLLPALREYRRLIEALRRRL